MSIENEIEIKKLMQLGLLKVEDKKNANLLMQDPIELQKFTRMVEQVRNKSPQELKVQSPRPEPGKTLKPTDKREEDDNSYQLKCSPAHFFREFLELLKHGLKLGKDIALSLLDKGDKKVFLLEAKSDLGNVKVQDFMHRLQSQNLIEKNSPAKTHHAEPAKFHPTPFNMKNVPKGS